MEHLVNGKETLKFPSSQVVKYRIASLHVLQAQEKEACFLYQQSYPCPMLRNQSGSHGEIARKDTTGNIWSQHVQSVNVNGAIINKINLEAKKTIRCEGCCPTFSWNQGLLLLVQARMRR